MAKKSKKVSKKNLNKKGGATDELFANGEPATGYNNLPEGTYEGYIKAGSAVIEPKEGSGHRASMTLIVTEPEDYVDRAQVARYDLSTQIGVNIFLGELETLGLEQPSSVKEAAECLSETDGLTVSFWVGPQKDEFPPKVRINELLEGEDSNDSDGNEENEAGEEEEESEEYTKSDLRKMSDEELDELAKDLGIDPDEYETYKELRVTIGEELGL